jgi:hypothetical protein
MIVWYFAHFSLNTVTVGTVAIVLEMSPHLAEETLTKHTALSCVVAIFVAPRAVSGLVMRDILVVVPCGSYPFIYHFGWYLLVGGYLG